MRRGERPFLQSYSLLGITSSSQVLAIVVVMISEELFLTSLWYWEVILIFSDRITYIYIFLFVCLFV
jgi:hypothetical protein